MVGTRPSRARRLGRAIHHLFPPPTFLLPLQDHSPPSLMYQSKIKASPPSASNPPTAKCVHMSGKGMYEPAAGDEMGKVSLVRLMQV
ncbi:hypothetical protein FA13DRAFT_1744956 [Coprinellus micaceus]|uniref:Uncharacterized protein n=1 Tax=Coprinellus micaceus TaxID=71717 RepID=A0A4Y7SDC9_COPMI|nr:hypothetical protein FA13DRAFT_1744956 [Coprinellus micaceus]